MKKSDLKLEIKNYIYEILSEEVNENTYVGPGAVDDLQKDLNFPKIKDKPPIINKLKKGESVTLEEKDNNKSAILKKLRGE
jgi:hypothetical protein